MARNSQVPGWNDDHVNFLTHHAHEMFGPTDFDNEVQKHLDRLYAQKDTPKDPLGSPEDAENMAQVHQQEAIDNLSSKPAQLGPPSLPGI